MKAWASNTNPSNHFFHSILSALYFALLAPFLASKTIDTYNGNPYAWVGVIMIIAMIFEAYAFPNKIALIKYRIKGKNSDLGTTAIILWFFHLTITFMAVFMLADSFGITINSKNIDFPLLFFLFMAIVFVKEIVFLMYIISEEKITQKKYRVLQQKEKTFDLILLIYSWLTYTILWTLISKVGDRDMHIENIGLYIINLFAASLLFFLAYLSFKIPSITEERLNIKTAQDKNKFYLSIFIVLAGALSRL